MTSQVAGSEGRREAIIGVGSCGLVLGSLVGGLHLLWAVLVASGIAQPLMDFLFWLHFIRPVYVIEGFDPLRAAGLVFVTAIVGYAIGCAFALLWNYVHRSRA